MQFAAQRPMPASDGCRASLLARAGAVSTEPSSRVQQIECSSSRCRAEGTREYARVDIMSIVAPSRQTAVMQNPPHSAPGR